MPLLSGRELERRVREGAAEGINLCIEHLLGASVPEAPVETGELRASGHVARRATPRDLVAELRFTAQHAAAQHEGEITYERGGRVVHAVFRRYPRGGGKRYVSNPLKANVHRYERIIAAAQKRRLEQRRGGERFR